MSPLAPSFQEFKSYARPGKCAAFLKRVDLPADPLEIFSSCRGGFQTRPCAVLLESARVNGKIGRYSIAAANPFLVFRAKGLENRPFEALGGLLKKYAAVAPRHFLPFAGGAIGYVGYEAKNLLESRLPQKAPDDLGLPDIYFLFFDEAVVFDHQESAQYLVGQVRVGRDVGAAWRLAQNKIRRLEETLRRRLNVISSELFDFAQGKLREREISSSKAGFLAPPFGGARNNNLESSLSRSQFLRSVRRVKNYIRRGDIYQANLSQRFLFGLKRDFLDVYRDLRRINPSSFFGILDAGDFQILSGSPERLVRLRDGVLDTRPIAGTRSRGRDRREDAVLSLDLMLNEKERAEHIMLVDLERNDLGRVCEYGSVRVDELMIVEDYSHVKHIVSNVRGVLRKGLDAVDAFKAFFPGGTITGTPKIRCMEIIDELEPVARGPYTGALGYFSFTGNMDFNILIRSLVVKDGQAYLQVGAGIVADSVPEKEYDETLYKAKAVLAAVFGEAKTRRLLRRSGASARVAG